MARLFIRRGHAARDCGAAGSDRADSRGIRPTPAAQVHLTLRFLGEVDAEQAARHHRRALPRCAAVVTALRVAGVGAALRGQQGSVLRAR
ncbi:2'-5' RNA ligase family protein [Cupriavidus basilensis]